MKVGAVILAAGLPSRIGAFKPALRLGDKTMLAHGVDVFRYCAIESILVVTGHRGEEVQAEAQRHGVRCCHHADFARGMVPSLQAAAKELPKLDGFSVNRMEDYPRCAEFHYGIETRGHRRC